MKKTLVIFDCFGVICGEIAPFIFAKYVKDPEEAKRLKDFYCHPADLGLIDEAEVVANIAKAVGKQTQELYDEWNSYVRLNEEIIPVIKKLGESADLAMLSNATKGLGDRCVEMFGLAPLFDKIFLSFEYGMAKPDPTYYKLCRDSFEKEYDEIFMIDDNPNNLEPLHALGIKGILYKDVNSIYECEELSKLLK